MGNKVITGVCTRDDSLDVGDLSSANFDFISVAMRSGSTCATPSSRAFVPASKMVVAVVPVDFSHSLNLSHHHSSSSPFDKVSTKPAIRQTSSTTITAASSPTPTPASDAEPELSFNDRLNKLTWDPEDFALPTRAIKHQNAVCTSEASISKPMSMWSTTRRPVTTSPEPAQRKCKTPFRWLSRTFSSYKSSAALKKQAEDLQKKTRQQQQQQDDQDKQQQQETTFKTRASSIKTQAMTKTIINHDQDQEPPVVQKMEQLAHDDHISCEGPISDTESESSATELSFPCGDVSPSSPSTMFAMAFSFFRKEPFSDSTGSCETFDNEHDDSDDDHVSLVYLSPSVNTSTVKMRGYLCDCSSCPAYRAIEREVTTSTCWMNECERQSICRILQAYSTYNEAVGFSKSMVAYAEECLLVFRGDENAAFNAFVRLGQEKWEK